jgi:hypothetical protein
MNMGTYMEIGMTEGERKMGESNQRAVGEMKEEKMWGLIRQGQIDC